MASNSSSNPLDNKAQAWSALFSEPMSELVQRYTASVGFDQRLWRADIQGSLAHARMLAAQGIIGAQDLTDIERGMAQIVGEIERGEFAWKLELEDVHLNIEARLTAPSSRASELPVEYWANRSAKSPPPRRASPSTRRMSSR